MTLDGHQISFAHRAGRLAFLFKFFLPAVCILLWPICLLLNAVEYLHCDTNRAQSECASGVPNSSLIQLLPNFLLHSNKEEKVFQLYRKNFDYNLGCWIFTARTAKHASTSSLIIWTQFARGPANVCRSHCDRKNSSGILSLFYPLQAIVASLQLPRSKRNKSKVMTT